MLSKKVQEAWELQREYNRRRIPQDLYWIYAYWAYIEEKGQVITEEGFVMPPSCSETSKD
jgi:hypothetical protein